MLNIIGYIHYNLPGVFLTNPGGRFVNGQLWTIPYEFECYAALVALSIIPFTRDRRIFAALIALGIIIFTVESVLRHPNVPTSHVPGRSLVFYFLCATSIYSFREHIPYSKTIGILSIVTGCALLQAYRFEFVAAIPLAYATVWLGMMNPRAIPFGDLSYGVFLFHYPIEQAIVAVSPVGLTWWALSMMALPASLICAAISWNLIEKPILLRKKDVLSFCDQLSGNLKKRSR